VRWGNDWVSRGAGIGEGRAASHRDGGGTSRSKWDDLQIFRRGGEEKRGNHAGRDVAWIGLREPWDQKESTMRPSRVRLLPSVWRGKRRRDLDEGRSEKNSNSIWSLLNSANWERGGKELSGSKGRWLGGTEGLSLF